MRLAGTKLAANHQYRGFGDQLYDLSGVRPSLDLNFSANKSLIDSASGQNLVTFTRASSGTFVGSDGLIKTAVTNEPRFDHNPTTGESLGLLVEEQRTNLAFPSNMPTSVVQTTTGNMQANGATQITSGVPAPDSSTNGFTVSGASATTNSSGSNNVRILSVMAAAGTHTVSMWIKTNSSSTTVTIRDATTSTGVGFVTTSSWTRITATFNNTSAGNIILLSTSGTAFDCFGVQVESGSFPTSYIPTTTATVTRSADVASITGSNFSSWYRQDEGTLFAEFQVDANLDTIQRQVFTFSDGTTSNRIRYHDRASASPQFRFEVAGVSMSTSLSTWNLGANKIAGSWSASSANFGTNGTLAALNISTVPTVNQITIGQEVLNHINAPIRRLTYWPQRLPDSTLQAVTQ
jgi:hypothetical protein